MDIMTVQSRGGIFICKIDILSASHARGEYKMSLRGVDLNLLPVLQALLRERSVTRASTTLGLSQPATSHALARLRKLLNDPLLVKVGRDMLLTPRAERLKISADQACASISALLGEADRFDPATADRAFSIGTPDYAVVLLGQELLRLLKQNAPSVNINMVDAGTAVREQLISGSLDLAFMARVPALLQDLSVYEGFLDPHVCIAALDHPLAENDCVSLAELNEHHRLGVSIAPHILLDFGEDHPSEPVRIGPSHLLAMPLLAAVAGSIAVVPRSLGQMVVDLFPLKLIELRDSMAPIDMCLAWNPVTDDDPAHQWLRSQLIKILERHFLRQ
jgi:DNA-binding transcriptional LysR family regulator